MSLLANLKTQDDIATAKDSVGGGGGPVESGLYNSVVSLAYLTTSSGGAIGLVLHLKTDGGRDLRQTLYMTSGTAKGVKNYYEDKQGQKLYLPGFTLANSLAQLTTGMEIGDLETETKVVNVYSYEAKAEVPTKVEVFTDMLNKEILVGVIKQTVDKNQKGDDGKYYPTGETREENEIDKFFHAESRKTVAEFQAKAEEAVFVNTWDQKWTGKVRDKTSKDAKGGTGTAGAPRTAGASAAGGKPKTSLFAS